MRAGFCPRFSPPVFLFALGLAFAPPAPAPAAARGLVFLTHGHRVTRGVDVRFAATREALEKFVAENGGGEWDVLAWQWAGFSEKTTATAGAGVAAVDDAADAADGTADAGASAGATATTKRKTVFAAGADNGLNPLKTLRNAEKQADAVFAQNDFSRYDRFHFIAHSAGTRLVAALAKKARAQNPRAFIHVTYLDAFTPSRAPGFGDAAAFLRRENTGADITEHYYDTRDLSLRSTAQPVGDAGRNYDITRGAGLFARFRFPAGAEAEIRRVAKASRFHHRWPFEFYLETVRLAGAGLSIGFEQSPEWREAAARKTMATAPAGK